MTIQPDTAYSDGLVFFSAVVDRLEPPDWERPSPCAGWRELDVLGHLGTVVEFGTKLLNGERPQFQFVDPPGSFVGPDPATWWHALVPRAREALRGVDLSEVVDSPFGRRSIGESLSFPAVDLHVHAWDLARGIGIDVQIPDSIIGLAHAFIDPIPAEHVRSERVFAAEATAPAGATAAQKFIAWTGRDPGWKPSP